MKISFTRFSHFFEWTYDISMLPVMIISYFLFLVFFFLINQNVQKSTVMYDPTYESRDITRSRNHVINHCRKLEMAYETPFIIFLNRAERNDSKWFMIFGLTGNRFRDDRKSRSTWSTGGSFYGFSHMSTILKDSNDFLREPIHFSYVKIEL